MAVSTHAAVHQARRRTSSTSTGRKRRNRNQDKPGRGEHRQEVVQRHGPVVAGVERLADHAVEAQLRPEIGAHPRTEQGHDDQTGGDRADRSPVRRGRHANG